MDYLSYNISKNLNRIRISRGMSLDVVAEQTGVSKSMLYQIEQGNANPSINVLGKIASGLRMEFTELIASPPEESYLVKISEVFPIKTGDKYTVKTCLPYEDNKKIEIYDIEIQPGGVYLSGGHGSGTLEYLVVTEGTLTVDTGREERDVIPGEIFRFSCEAEHRYINNSESKTEFICFFVA
ncbi:MAG: helix-turn-helix domain-containing protein [Oscillospiraceae bacterium]